MTDCQALGLVISLLLLLFGVGWLSYFTGRIHGIRYMTRLLKGKPK